jgi:hypothetical protein
VSIPVAEKSCGPLGLNTVAKSPETEPILMRMLLWEWTGSQRQEPDDAMTLLWQACPAHHAALNAVVLPTTHQVIFAAVAFNNTS